MNKTYKKKHLHKIIETDVANKKCVCVCVWWEGTLSGTCIGGYCKFKSIVKSRVNYFSA